jgi:LacI family transcriptional regulator
LVKRFSKTFYQARVRESMRRKTTTIRDVAQQAGVSVSTVSHVLNGNDWHVSPVVRQRVLEVVEELNYRPNAIARSMVKRSTATIGLVINDIENQHFVPVIGGVNEVLQPAGYHMVLASAADLQGEIEAIETLRAQQVDGFIFMALSFAYPIDHLVRLKEHGIPFVVINRSVDDLDINQVLLDDQGASYDATRHLIALGHTRIGTICGPLASDPPRRSALDRLAGWRQALIEHGLDARSEWAVEGHYTYEGGYYATRQLLTLGEEIPTALFVANDVMAMGGLKALHEAGVRVPQEMAMVAVGDSPFAAYTIPTLTALALPMTMAGAIAARMLLDGFKEEKPVQAQQIMLKCALKVRESCGAQLLSLSD